MNINVGDSLFLIDGRPGPRKVVTVVDVSSGSIVVDLGGQLLHFRADGTEALVPSPSDVLGASPRYLELQPLATSPH